MSNKTGDWVLPVWVASLGCMVVVGALTGIVYVVVHFIVRFW